MPVVHIFSLLYLYLIEFDTTVIKLSVFQENWHAYVKLQDYKSVESRIVQVLHLVRKAKVTRISEDARFLDETRRKLSSYFSP